MSSKNQLPFLAFCKVMKDEEWKYLTYISISWLLSMKHRERKEEEVVMCWMCLLISELLWSVRAERVYNKMLAADDCVGADSGSIGASVAISPENYFTPITGKIFQKWAWQWRCLANHCSDEFILFRQELKQTFTY